MTGPMRWKAMLVFLLLEYAEGYICLPPRSTCKWMPQPTVLRDPRSPAHEFGLPHTLSYRRPLALAMSASAAGNGDGDLLFATTSAHSNGEIQVREMVQGGTDDTAALVRALWFSTSPGAWQSAVMMRRVGDGVVPDWSVLPFPSSRAHAFASALVQKGFAQTAMMMGLGAGTLAGWLLHALPSCVNLSCSELDPQVREIATSYFGLNAQDPRLTLQVGDALQHAAEAKAQGR